MDPLLGLNIIDGTVLAVLAALSLVALAYLVVRRRPRRWPSRRLREFRAQSSWSTRRWLITVGIAAAAGALIAVLVLWLSEGVFNVFGLPLDADTHGWVIAAFAGIAVAVVNFPRSRWWRRTIAALSVVLFLVTATVGINAAYGMNATVAAFLNIQTGHPVAVPKPVPTPSSTPTGPPKPLWQTWVAPAGMPAQGSFGTVTIPATVSGFVARPAYLYLPPAALVKDPPALPILIMMMGQPGGPESSALFLPTLNALAAAHHGLGPIVLTIDQIGNPYKNPLCIDSSMGKVHTYVMTDVVNYVRSTLHVATGPRNWAVGGYSNGGECAMSFGGKHPDVFGSIVSISGEITPSLGSVATTIQRGFGGDRAAYTAELPLTIWASKHYADTTAIFTVGGNDPVFGPEAAKAEAAAKAAGMTTYRFVGPGVGHRADAVQFGVPKAIPLLYPRWNLEAPTG